MKVKIKDTIYDGSNIPIMVILTEFDKENIGNMPDENRKYCEYPERFDSSDILKWMDGEIEWGDVRVYDE